MRIELGLAALLSLTACQGFKAQAPAGFAAYDDTTPFRAVSPDGVVFRVREDDNDPEEDLSFWCEALKKRMLDAGYAFVREDAIKAQDHEGYVLELAAPIGMTDYAYLVGVFVRGSELVVVEASGEVTRFAARRESVLQAIAALQI